MTQAVKEIRIKGRVHRVFIEDHPEGGVQLFSSEIPQSPIWAERIEQGLQLMRELLGRLGRGEDFSDMVLPGGPMARSSEKA